jgi:hypothetical protein
MKTRQIFLASFFAAITIASPVHADIAGRFETVGDDSPIRLEMTIEADEAGNVRTQMARLGAYYLLRDGELYQVAHSDGEQSVVRVADLMTLQAELSKDFFPDEPTPMDQPLQRFAAMGNEVVQGRSGIGYGMVSEDSPEPRYASIVVSKDPSLAPLGRAIVASNEAMAGSLSAMGQMGTTLALMNEDMLAVLLTGAPIRLLDLELTDLSSEPIPSERFALPAEPLTIAELRKRMMPHAVEPPPTLPSHEVD